MKRFVDAIRRAVANENWYAAVSLSLTMPDVCARLEGKSSNVGERYRDWFNRFLATAYMLDFGPGREMVLFNAEECYALRCSYLHGGSGELEDTKVREALERVRIVLPPMSGRLSNIREIGRKEHTVQADDFCEKMCAGVERWLEEVAAKDESVGQRMAQQWLRVETLEEWWKSHR